MAGVGTLARIDDAAPQPDDPNSPRPERRSTVAALLAGAAVVLLFVTVQTVAFGLLVAMGRELPAAGEIGVGDAVTLGAVQLAGIAVAALLAGSWIGWRRVGLGAGDFGRGWNALLPVGLLVITPSLGMALASGDEIFDPDLTTPLVLLLVGLAIAIGVNEELWFRGLLVDQLATARRPWVTVLGSAVLFGLPHAVGGSAYLLNAVAVTLAVGVPFSVVRVRAGGLGPLIVWHALIDAWAFLHTASVTPEGSPTLADAAAALVLPTLVALGYLAWFARGLREAEPADRPR